MTGNISYAIESRSNMSRDASQQICSVCIRPLQNLAEPKIQICLRRKGTKTFFPGSSRNPSEFFPWEGFQLSLKKNVRTFLFHVFLFSQVEIWFLRWRYLFKRRRPQLWMSAIGVLIPTWLFSYYEETRVCAPGSWGRNCDPAQRWRDPAHCWRVPKNALVLYFRVPEAPRARTS